MVAIIVPDKEVLEEWAKTNFPSLSFKELCFEDKVIKTVYEDTIKTAREFKLKGFEIARAIYLEPEPFSESTGLLTPTFKNKRKKKFFLLFFLFINLIFYYFFLNFFLFLLFNFIFL